MDDKGVDDKGGQRFIDLIYPFCWYKSDFGVNTMAVKKVFGANANS